MKNIFRRSTTVEIPAGVQLYINFYDVEVPEFSLFQKRDMLTIEFMNVPNVPKRYVYGKVPTHIEVYGPFMERTECMVTFDSEGIWLPHRSKYKIGLYERQILLPLGICGNINLL